MAETFTSKQQTAGIREQIAQDGGPAFPHPQGWRRNPEISDGMSKREWFAGQALAGLMSNPRYLAGADDAATRRGLSAAAIVAELAFAVADEMLTAAEPLPRNGGA